MDLEKINQYKQQIEEDAEKAELLSTIKSANGMLAKTIVATDKQVKKVKVLNDLAKPQDIQNVVSAVNKLGQDLKPKDFKPIIEALNSVSGALAKLPTEYPQFPEITIPEQRKDIKVTNLDQLKDYFSEVVQAVNSLQTSVKFDPKIEVKPADVIVQEKQVDLSPLKDITKGLDNVVKAVKAIKTPQQDNTELLQGLEAVKNSINGLVFPTANYVLPFKDVDGKATQVQLDSNGYIPTTIGNATANVIDPLAGYNLNNAEEGATYTYVGLEDASGNWAIKRITIADNTTRYAKGSSGYATAWTNRASQTYDTFDNTFAPVTGSVITSATSINSVMQATQDDGTVVDVPATAEGHMEVAIHGPLNPFGSVHTENLTPIFQTDAVYGLNPQQVVATTGLGYDPGPAIGSNTGSATASGSMFTCATGTTAYSFAALQSRRRLRYRPGQGMVGRFTAKWSAPVASSIVVAGFGSGESGYYFGYNGTSFGVLHSTGGVREIQTYTVTAAVSSGGTATFRLNGLDTTVTLATSATTVLTANNIAAQTFPGWDVEAVGSTVIFTANSVGNKAGTFSVTLGTAIGLTGSFAETLAGVAATDTWIAQTAWNGDKCDGTGASNFTLDQTKGNVFQINVAWLGFGPIEFKILMPSVDGNNANWTTVHTINNPNSRTTVHTTQPSFPFTMAAYSAGSTTNVSVSTASFAGFIEGIKKSIGPRFTYNITSGVTSSTSTYKPLFSIRNSNVFNGRANQSVVNLLSVGGASTSNTGITSFYIIRNGTLTGGSWSQYSTTSATYFDNTATEVSFSNNNQIIWTGTIAKDGNFVFPFTDEITLQPGEWVTLAVRSVTATATCVGQLNTREDQ